MALHWAASGGHAEIVKFLLKNEADVDARDEVCICNRTGLGIVSALPE